MEDWIANGELFKADANAQYAAVIEIDLAEVTERILACPNDPDDVKILSEVAGACRDVICENRPVITVDRKSPR